ncbi:thioredoxin family protein [Shewanella psychropiezotolerans]|uniref:Thioredoxin family protein n=1 Tax=Shewanella psychropiezotolerans TaxID=2593655 RepID=A0ABX5WV57_9GAMM|nr:MULTISPECIES: thioredoxin family protein [Shewanella]MPY22744.1 thioredoxin family protein [Shewanella sp. YLB-07]QDO82974.1 thioredoxin family protein [Shewanella psychropiezotolerans]
MHVQLLVTHTDFCIHNLERELNNVGIQYRIDYIEDNPKQMNANHIRHSPSIFIEDKLVFRYQPSPTELKTLLANEN